MQLGSVYQQLNFGPFILRQRMLCSSLIGFLFLVSAIVFSFQLIWRILKTMTEVCGVTNGVKLRIAEKINI